MKTYSPSHNPKNFLEFCRIDYGHKPQTPILYPAQERKVRDWKTNQQGAMTMTTADLNTRHIDGMIAQTTNPAEVARLTDLRDRGAEFSKAENRHGETRSGWWLDGVYLGKTTRDAMQAIR